MEPNGGDMERDLERTKVLEELGGGGIILVRQEKMGRPPKPAIERLRGECRDGKRASVWWFRMPYRHNRNLILLPVSVGCELRNHGEEQGWRTGCKFCTVGRGSFEGYLTPEQMLGFARLALERAHLASDYWANSSGNMVVFFSSAGEPLLHYRAVATVIRRLKVIFGHKLFVSISTSGVASGIKELLDDSLKVQLRLSLHFATDENRKKFMPVQDSIGTLLDLGARYARRSGIPLMVKYVLIQGVNDSDDDARELAHVLQPYRDCIWVRVARLNPYGGDLKPPSNRRRNHFRAILIGAGFRTVQVWKGFATLGCDVPHYEN